MHEVATRSTYTTSSFFTLERHQERGRNLHNSLLEFLASKPTSSHSRTIHGASFVRMEKEKKKKKVLMSRLIGPVRIQFRLREIYEAKARKILNM